jgi:hypothetical protein
LQIKGFLDVPERFKDPGEDMESQGIPVSTAVSKKTRKVFAFADDCNTLILLTKSNLLRIGKILGDYFLISGLECNIEKSFLLPIGDTDDAEVEVANTGFVITDNLKVLGMILKNECETWPENEQKINKKVKAEINFWKRFNLSLPGRLNISKTMLYSQLNYLGSFLPLSSNFVIEIENIIGEYVRGNLKMATDRIFKPTNMGGLGLFRVKTFLRAQNCSWFKRAMSLDELWKLEFFSPAPGDFFSIRKNMSFSDPILHNVAVSFSEFLKNFTIKGDFKKCFILDNEAFTLGIRKKDLLTIGRFGDAGENTRIKKGLFGLTLKDIVTEQNIKPIEELERICGLNIGMQLYRDLYGLVAASFIKYGRETIVGISIKTFFTTLKKGSKKVRLILEEKVPDSIPHNIMKFAQNTDTVIGLESSKKINNSWLNHFFSNEIRTFQFKLINNILGLNYIICHFVQSVERNCTLCDVARNPDPEDESPLHLFYTCNITENLLNDLFDDIGTVISRQEFFSFPQRQNMSQNLVLFWISILTRKFIWDCKQRSVLPSIDFLKTFIFKEFRIMTGISRFVRSAVENCDLSYLFRSGCLDNFSQRAGT